MKTSRVTLAQLPGPGLAVIAARLWAPLLLLLLFEVSQYWAAWRVPFLNEDYSFLDVTRGRPFWAFWSDPGLYAGPWLRPWSQGFHYWLFQRLLGTNVAWWHAVSVSLVVLALTSYYVLVRRVVGSREAGIAASCVATLVGWGLLVTWIAGVQDLWMLAFSLAFLHAGTSGHRAWAAVALILALASKETAAVLPALMAAWHLVVERRSVRDSWGRTWPMWLIVAAWALVHPSIGGHWRNPHTAPTSVTGSMTLLEALGSALLAVVNLDVWPRPERGWLLSAGLALLGLPALIGLVVWSRGGHESSGRDDAADQDSRPATTVHAPGRIALFGLSWAFLGWIPLLQSSLNWHSYYSVFGSMGAWLTIGVIMNRTPKLLVAMLLAALALIRSGRSATVIHDWGEESYVRRAGEMLDVLRADLQDKVPSPEPHSRLYFHRVPSEVGFLIGDGPSLRVWYDDSTLRGGFWRDFRVRDRHEAPGPDCFFRYDTLACWVEVASGAEDVAGSRQRNPDWFSDHVRLARTLSNGEDWAAAFREYSKLSEVRPDDPSIAFMAGLSALARGDSVQAKHWIGRAALSASADAEIRATARALGLPIPHLHSESR